ncbi:hypothetical protein [Caenispirillum bisanense]|uniref:Uncharacterized protein n=1 Tax=Caenispirillum bisanense TaxID=414052 RepID=A0A286GE53_9PROT|nr:hypothetical protein [Caenispirillum bisanense]SOD93803.1 hypothetical protein SAMN05421508_103205 [Caenispirillum bisanense]
MTGSPSSPTTPTSGSSTAKAPAPLPHPKASSSVTGPIRRLLLTIAADVAQNLQMQAVYRAILVEMPATTSFVIVVNPAVQALVEGWVQQLNMQARVQQIVFDADFTAWARDPFVAVTTDGDATIHLAQPEPSGDHPDTQIVAQMVAAPVPGIAAYPTPLYFDGGNVLAGDDFCILGANERQRTLDMLGTGGLPQPQPPTTPEELVDLLFQQYIVGVDRALHWLGLPDMPEQEEVPFEHNGEEWEQIFYYGNDPGAQQPVFHIDMFLTLMGREDDGYHVLLGSPTQAAYIMTGQMQTPPEAQAEAFDALQTQLQEMGFIVHRNPMPLIYQDDPVEKLRTWYYAAYNNALVQVDETGRRVWLPSFAHGIWQQALQQVEQANVQIWQERGFEVTLMPDFQVFTAMAGALRCITNDFDRGEA